MVHAKKLNHVNINVSDITRSLRFYQEGLGLKVAFWEGKTTVFLNSPGADDTITLCAAGDGDTIGNGGVSHFGFSVGAANMDEAIGQIERAGGKLLRRAAGAFPSRTSPIPTAT